MSDAGGLQMGFLQEEQWQLSSMQLVNFGPFDGHHLFEFKTGFDAIPTTVVAGDSGTGKSTLEDAFFEVMTRNGSYNTASNEGGRGGSLSSDKRSLIGYVRGKLEDVEDANGNPVAQMLRDGSRNRWSAVVLTYASDAQTTFTVAKLFWIGAGYNTNSDIKQLRLTMYRPFDPRVLESIADVNFTAERVRRVIGGDFKSFARVDEFLTYVYRVLKIDELGRGKDVMDLLGRIRSGAGFRSIAELFREQVLDVPATFDRAAEAAESYHKHWEAYERMRDKQNRVNALKAIEETGEDLGKATAQLEAHGAALSADVFAMWELMVRQRLLRASQTELEVREETLAEQLDARNAELERATAERDALQRQLNASGFTERLAMLDAAIDQAKARVRSCREASKSCAREVEPHFGSMPTSKEEFDDLKARVEQFQAGYGEASERAQEAYRTAVERHVALDTQARELRDDLAYFEKHKSRIPRRLGEAREALAAAAGIDPEHLPFAAELMEVADESWRYAIESVYGGFARTLLVAEEDFEGFSRSIDKLRLRSRVSFRKVATGTVDSIPRKQGYLSQKLLFKEESPFSSWLVSTVCDEHHDALCVRSAKELAGEGRRVTKNGQTRDGNRGAHGRDAGAEGIIGFDNTAKLEELAGQLVALVEPTQQAAGQERKAQRELDELTQKKGAAERIVRYDFAQVDLLGARVALEEAEGSKQRFVDANERLGELEGRLQQANGVVTELTKQVGSLEGRLDETRDELGDAVRQIRELVRRQRELPAVDTGSDAYALLEKAGAERFEGHGARDNLRTFSDSVSRVRSTLTTRKQEWDERVGKHTRSLERQFEKYLEDWPDTHLGTTTSALPDYLALLSKLEEEGFHTQKETWYEHMVAWIKEDLIPLDVAYREARNEIYDRLEPINAILHTLPFGREGGRLEIVCRDSEPKAARDFSRLLRQLLDYEREQSTITEEVYHRRAAKIMEIIDPTDTRTEVARRRNEVLDRRRHVTLSARVVDADDSTKVLGTIKTLASKSGGEVAEIVAFILGAALLYRLGQDGGSKPGFAPVLLDEGFIKADSRFTSRAISAWQGFGFQLIIAVPEEKYQSVVSKAERVLNIVADASRRSYVSRLDLVGEEPHEAQEFF